MAIHLQEMNLDSSLIVYKKSKSKWVININVKNFKLYSYKRKPKKKLLWHGFLRCDTNNIFFSELCWLCYRRKKLISKMSSKLRTSFLTYTIKGIKTQGTNWEKIFTNISNDRFVSKIHNELLKHTIRWQEIFWIEQNI